MTLRRFGILVGIVTVLLLAPAANILLRNMVPYALASDAAAKRTMRAEAMFRLEHTPFKLGAAEEQRNSTILPPPPCREFMLIGEANERAIDDVRWLLSFARVTAEAHAEQRARQRFGVEHFSMWQIALWQACIDASPFAVSCHQHYRSAMAESRPETERERRALGLIVDRPDGTVCSGLPRPYLG